MRSIIFNQNTKIFGLLLGAMVTFSSCEGEMEVVQSIDEEFLGIQRIEIDAEFMDVNYEGRDGQTTVKLDGFVESSRSGSFRIEYKQEGNKLDVELDRRGVIGRGNHRAKVTLIGPKNIDLEVESESGNTVIAGIEHSRLEVSAESGNIQVLTSKVPTIRMEIASGNIGAYNIIGNVQAKASSGNVEIEQVQGNANINSSSGRVQVKNLTGKLNVELSSGNIQMNDVSEIERLKVSSGNISGSKVGLGPQTKLITSSGKISIQTFTRLNDYNYDFEAGSGRVVVGESSSSGSLKINNGAASTITGSVSSGLIEIKN
jgi:lia operon protein LiaG